MPPGNELGPLSIVVVDIGNTTTAVAQWIDGDVADVTRVASAESRDVFAALAGVRQGCANQTRQAIVIASVVPEATKRLAEHVDQDLELRPFVIGENTPLPVDTAVREPQRVGVDRVCAAAAAFYRTGHACAIVDIGSAVTVDYIDDEGTFQGGAILPGIALQAGALAEHTAQLPRVEPQSPISVLGRDTEEAIASGLVYGLAGAIRGIVEGIATECNKWPQVVITGGGVAVLKDYLDFADSWVPDLCLMGVGLAYVRRAAEQSSR